MPADRPGQCDDDDEIAFGCGNERTIGGKPRDLERPTRPDGAARLRPVAAGPLGGAVQLVLDLLGRDRRWSCRYLGPPGRRADPPDANRS